MITIMPAKGEETPLMRFNTYKLFIWLIFTGLLATACLGGARPVTAPELPTPSPTPLPKEPVTLTWAFWGDPWEVEINKQIIKFFETDHPNIRIKILHYPWSDYFKEMRAKLETGAPVADVLFWAQEPIDVPKGYFMDIKPLMEAENYSMEDFFAGLLIPFEVKDGIYGLPRDSDTKVIFYNKRIFNRADLPFPKAGWTWDDLRATSLALKEAGVVDYSFAYEANDWWMIWMWQNGVSVFDDKLYPTRT